MKRSQRIATLTLGGAFVVMLAACGESAEEMKVYKTVDECVAETNDRALCEGEKTAAQLNHEDSAPRFTDEQACKQEFESCTAVRGVDGTPSWFMPVLGGFVLGRLLGQSSAQPVFYDRKGYAYVRNLPQDMRRDDNPYYSSSSTSYRSGTGSSGVGTTSTASGAQSVAASSGGYSRVSAGSSSGTISVSRGGFGSSGHSSSSS